MHNEKVHKPAGLEKPVSSRACSAPPIRRSIGKVETQEKVVEHVRVNHDLCFVLRRSDMDVARLLCAADLFFPFLTPPRIHNGHLECGLPGDGAQTGTWCVRTPCTHHQNARKFSIFFSSQNVPWRMASEAVDRYFDISRRGSTIGTELRAGLTSFLTLRY